MRQVMTTRVISAPAARTSGGADLRGYESGCGAGHVRKGRNRASGSDAFVRHVQARRAA